MPAFRTEPTEPPRMPLALMRWRELAAVLDGHPLCDEPMAGSRIDYRAVRRHLREADPALQEALAEWLAGRPDLPRDIARDFALDRIEVARPVLQQNAALNRRDLMDVIEETSREHHLAIAGRASLVASVAEFLVEVGDGTVLLALLENPGVHLPPVAVARLVGAALHDSVLRAPLLARPELTEDQARVLGEWGDEALRRRVADRFDTGPAAKPVRESSWQRVKELIAVLRQGDRLTVETAFARLVGLPSFAMARIVNNPEPEPLAIVCRALSLKRPLYAALYLQLHGTRPYGNFRRSQVFHMAMAAFDHIQKPQAQRVLDAWRRAPVTVWHHGGGWHGHAHWAL